MARIVLLEDDAQIRRFVALVLDRADVELVGCATVAEALQAFERGPVDLAICDLMLAGESGFDLMERIVLEPAWRETPVAVFSAAIDAEDRARLAALGVRRQLPKPVGVAELLACVDEALGAHAIPAAASSALAPPACDADEQAAVTRFFAGDRALFLAYRQTCRAQFRRDVEQGDEAIALGDDAALRRLAHSLKTVLATLGHERAAERFASLESAAADGRSAELRELWRGGRALLSAAAGGEPTR